jgi:hypothetical protein
MKSDTDNLKEEVKDTDSVKKSMNKDMLSDSDDDNADKEDEDAPEEEDKIEVSYIPKEIDVLILDSPFATFKGMVHDVILSQHKVCKCCINIALSGVIKDCKKKVEHDLTMLKPINAVPHIDIPCFYIVAKEDMISRPEKVKQLFLSTKSEEKYYHLVEGEHPSQRNKDILKKAILFVLDKFDSFEIVNFPKTIHAPELKGFKKRMKYKKMLVNEHKRECFIDKPKPVKKDKKKAKEEEAVDEGNAVIPPPIIGDLEKSGKKPGDEIVPSDDQKKVILDESFKKPEDVKEGQDIQNEAPNLENNNLAMSFGNQAPSQKKIPDEVEELMNNKPEEVLERVPTKDIFAPEEPELNKNLNTSFGVPHSPGPLLSDNQINQPKITPNSIPSIKNQAPLDVVPTSKKDVLPDSIAEKMPPTKLDESFGKNNINDLNQEIRQPKKSNVNTSIGNN